MPAGGTMGVVVLPGPHSPTGKDNPHFTGKRERDVPKCTDGHSALAVGDTIQCPPTLLPPKFGCLPFSTGSLPTAGKNRGAEGDFCHITNKNPKLLPNSASCQMKEI